MFISTLIVNTENSEPDMRYCKKDKNANKIIERSSGVKTLNERL